MPGTGVLGGTFDPIHIGHLVVAADVRHRLDLDRVLLMVANEPWQKTGDRRVTAAEVRFELVCAALDGGPPGLEASRLEIDRGGPSYMADTLDELASAGVGGLHLIVGSDVGDDLRSWHRWERVAELATVVVVDRPGAPLVDPGPPFTTVHVDVPALEVSSSDVRARLAEGRPIDFLVPPGAVRRIEAEALYSGRR